MDIRNRKNIVINRGIIFSVRPKKFLMRSNPGVANQSETKSHNSYCVTAKSHMIRMGTREHHPISSLKHKCARVCMCLHKPPGKLARSSHE